MISDFSSSTFFSFKFFQVSSGLEINYMRIGFANPYSEKHTLHSVFFSFPPTSSFPSPQSLFFFPHFIYGVEMGEKLKAQYEWMGCLLHNWKCSLINDFVHAGVRISSSYWEGGFCIISWFASILIPLECQTCQVVTNSHCLIWGSHSLLPIRIKMPPHVT